MQIRKPQLDASVIYVCTYVCTCTLRAIHYSGGKHACETSLCLPYAYIESALFII